MCEGDRADKRNSGVLETLDRQTYLWAFALDLSWCHKEVGYQEEHVLSLEGKAGG